MSHELSAEDFVLTSFLVSDAFLFFFLIGGLIITGRRNDPNKKPPKLSSTELETFDASARPSDQNRQLVITKDAVARFLAHGHLSGIVLVLNLEYGDIQFPPVMAVLPVISYYTYNLYRSVTQDSQRKVLRRGIVNFIQLLGMQLLFMIKYPGWFMFDGRYAVLGVIISIGFILDMGQQMDYLDTYSTRYRKCDVYVLLTPWDAWLAVSAICVFTIGAGIASTVNADHAEYFLVVFVFFFGGVLVRTAISAAVHLPAAGEKYRIARDKYQNPPHHTLEAEILEEPTNPVIRHLWNALLSLMALLTSVMTLLEAGHLIPRRDRNPALSVGIPLLITVGFTVIGVAYTSLNGDEPLDTITRKRHDVIEDAESVDEDPLSININIEDDLLANGKRATSARLRAQR